MSTPDDQSIQRLPHGSLTMKSSALSHTMGGCPAMERGSDCPSDSKMGSDSGTGSLVLMRRYFVSTAGTSTGVKS